MFCINCGKELPDDSTFCIFCGSSVTESTTVETPAEVSAEPVTKKKRTKRKKLLPWLIAGGVVVVAVVVLLIVLLSGTSPKEGIENLINKGNFTVELKVLGNKMEIQVDVDWKKEELTIYAETGGEFAFAIYDGYYITESYYYGYSAEDYSDVIDAFFEAYQSANEADWDDIAALIEYLTLEDVEEYIDVGEFGDCMDTFLDKLENKRWLKENAGYSTERENGVKLHIYEPDLYKFATASLEIFKGCFEYREDYNDLLDQLKYMRSELKQIDLTLTLGVKGKYLVSAEAEVMGVTVKVFFNDIGKTRIDTDDLEDILDQAFIFW